MPDNEKRPVHPDDLFRLKFIQGGRLSPDARHVVYAVSHIDAAQEQEFISLWLFDLETNTAHQWTRGDWRDSDPCWSPDGQEIAFISNRSGQSQIYCLALHNDEARQITSLKQGVRGGPAWSPDGQYIAFTAAPKNQHEAGQPYRVNRDIYRYDGIGNIDSAADDLYIIASSGGEARQLTDDRCVNRNPLWSPDGSQLLYTAAMLPDSYHSLKNHLRIITLNGQIRDVLGDWCGAIIANWLPDSRHVIFIDAIYEPQLAVRLGRRMIFG